MISSKIFLRKLNKDRLTGRKPILVRLGSFLLIIIMLLILVYSLDLSIVSLISIRTPLTVIVTDLIYSFARVTIITLAAWIIAIITGACINTFPVVRQLTFPLVNLLRHISPFAWFPFAIIWFGLGEYPIAFVLFITLFFPALITAVEVFANIPGEFTDEAKVCGADIFQQFYYIEMPIGLTQLMNLFRVLWGVGWTMVIAAEMLGTAKGLGYRLLDFRYLLHYEEMIVYIAVMGLVGVAVDEVLTGLNKKLNY